MGTSSRRAVRRWGWVASPALLLVALTGCDTKAPTAANGEVEKRVAALEEKLTATEAKLAATETKLAAFETRLAAAERTASAPTVATTPPVGDAPQIFAAQPVHDFGKTWAGEVLNHTFSITNRGKTPLKITNVKPDCGCTVARSYPRELAPGATGQFPFTMDSSKLNGRYSKYITITTNDPAQKTYRLTLRGELKRYVQVTPKSAFFGTVFGNEPKVKTLKIVNNGDEPLELTLTPPATKKFKFELIEKTAGKNYDLVVSTVPPHTPGPINAIATLTTNIGATRTIKVRAVARVPERIETQPAALRLRRPSPSRASTPITRPIYVRNYGETPVKVLEATASDPALEVTLTEQVAGKTYRVQVKFPANYTPPVGATLTLKTDDAEKPEILVPIQRWNQPRPSPVDLIGRTAPSFEANTVAGKPVKAGADDTITVLNFFAGNCGYCKRQLPRLETVRKQFADKPVRFVNISQTMRTRRFTEEQITTVLDGLGVSAELVLDPDNKIGKPYRVSSYPAMVIVGKTGKIEAVTMGDKTDIPTRVKAQLDALLAGKPVPVIAPPPPAVRAVRRPTIPRVTPLPTPVPAGGSQ